MALLHISFQEGFADDAVVIRVNGKEVFRKASVKTKLQIGYADSFEADVQEGPTKVEVFLPLRKISDSIVLEMSAAYVGVSLTPEDRITYRISDRPFMYL